MGQPDVLAMIEALGRSGCVRLLAYNLLEPVGWPAAEERHAETSLQGCQGVERRRVRKAAGGRLEVPSPAKVRAFLKKAKERKAQRERGTNAPRT